MRRLMLLITAFAALAVGIAAGYFAVSNYFVPQQYVGQSTMMLAQVTSTASQKNMRSTTDLAQIAKSQEVMRRTAENLLQLGITQDPVTVLRAANAHPVQSTNVLAVEITSTDPEVAKAAADVYAYSVKKVVAEKKLFGNATVKTIDAAYVFPTRAKFPKLPTLLIGLLIFIGAIVSAIALLRAGSEKAPAN